MDLSIPEADINSAWLFPCARIEQGLVIHQLQEETPNPCEDGHLRILDIGPPPMVRDCRVGGGDPLGISW